MDITPDDVKQAKIFLRLFENSKLEIKGDALFLAATSFSWFHSFVQKMSVPPVEEEVPATKPSRKKV